MKKLIPAALILSLLLTGCAPLGATYRELDQLMLIETLGIDSVPGAVRVSAGAKAGDGDTPVTLTATGATAAEAVGSLHDSAYAEELFFAHTQRVLIGEATAAKGIAEHLSFVCQSTEVRLGVPVYIIEGSSAGTFLSSVAEDGEGVSAVLEAIETENRRLDAPVFSAADIARDMAAHGSALACALKMHPGEDGSAPTAVFSGCAVLKDGTLRGFIGEDELCGLGMLLGKAPLRQVTVKDMYGADVTLELVRGSTAFSPEFDGDELTALNVSCEVGASVVEVGGSGSFSADGYALFLEKQLEAALLGQMRAVISLSQELNSDFLGLAERTELAAPMKFRRMKDTFANVFPGLNIAMSVSAGISHSNDIGD